MFFHGGGTVTGFDAMLPLAESGRLIVPIHPGFGASVDDPTIDSLQDYHLHYLDLFERMGLGEISLAGLSLGGALAAWFAIQQPGRVRRLALAAPWGLRVPEHPTVDIFSIPDEEVLSYLFADLTPFAGMPISAAAGVPRGSLPRGDLARARALEAALRPQAAEVAAPHRGADARRLGRVRPPDPAGAGGRVGRAHRGRAGAHAPGRPAISSSTSRPTPLPAVAEFMGAGVAA